jgi:hypothetical protein
MNLFMQGTVIKEINAIGATQGQKG